MYESALFYIIKILPNFEISPLEIKTVYLNIALHFPVTEYFSTINSTIYQDAGYGASDITLRISLDGRFHFYNQKPGQTENLWTVQTTLIIPKSI